MALYWWYSDFWLSVTHANDINRKLLNLLQWNFGNMLWTLSIVCAIQFSKMLDNWKGVPTLSNLSSKLVKIWKSSFIIWFWCTVSMDHLLHATSDCFTVGELPAWWHTTSACSIWHANVGRCDKCLHRSRVYYMAMHFLGSLGTWMNTTSIKRLACRQNIFFNRVRPTRNIV